MAHPQPREERTAAGVLLMALAVLWFTCIDSSAKWLILGGLPALQVVFTRYVGHFLIAVLVYGTRDRAAFRSNAPGKQLLRSLFLLGSTVLNFSALQFLPITVTTTIMFAGPIVVTLLAIPILGERVGLRRLVAVCVGFVGVLVVMQPWGASFHPAMFLTLGALCMASMYFIMTRLLAGVEANATQQIWSSGIASLALAPFVWQAWVWPTGNGWIAFVLIGAFGAMGHIAATTAHRWADASILAPVIYIQIFLAAAAGVMLFDTWPTVWTLGGGLIIVASGLYIWQRERAVRGKVRRPVPATR
ncbi:DMT family transporter [Tropicibacter naphthalenivorans]|uniref:Phosphonate utilization associated putative membrane protein n=1 Tax=Tropicibacter naphthalenivorans TaxID=441103 RepID=A0A0P1G2N1_9RHOB|nr:DMT family transporter [Tropicibacter naphthalenivorans]CUH75999.1 phosphonate utilization associated putative membrane protein [Tropicibacter naphthalenivorans]SMC40674.1 Permease of the drug/metabolite transporter (DMT) superfamily [Tropicibacter naphthalenivorans]